MTQAKEGGALICPLSRSPSFARFPDPRLEAPLEAPLQEVASKFTGIPYSTARTNRVSCCQWFGPEMCAAGHLSSSIPAIPRARTDCVKAGKDAADSRME
jgi:hypothetical protein